MYFRYFFMIYPCTGEWPFIWTKFYTLYPRIFCEKFSWKWQNGSVENFNFFQYIFAITLLSTHGKGDGPSLKKKEDSLPPRMLYGKFGWNLPSGAREKDENVNNLQTRMWSTGGQKSHLSFQLIKAISFEVIRVD